MKRRVIIIIAGAVLASAAVFAMTMRKQEAVPPVNMQPKAALTVTVEKPDYRTWPQRLAASGNVQAWQEAVIGSEVSGLRLAELFVNVGDVVKKGQVLARFTDEMVELELEQQRAAVEEARARQTQAEAKAESSAKLRESGMISALEHIQNQSNAQIAKAQMQAAEARLKAQKLRLAYTQVKAPDDGIISSRTATVGAVLQTGNEMFRYIRRNQVEWRAEVPEEPLLRLKPGQKVVLHTSYGEFINGRVSRISPVVDAQSRNGSVFVELLNMKHLRAGMFAQGEFELGQSRAMTVSQSAVVVRDGYSYVFKVGEDNRVSQQKVLTGRRQEGRMEITDGLDPNARVVTAGAGFLGDGDLVRIGQVDAATGKRASR